jgi:hypothetical protein
LTGAGNWGKSSISCKGNSLGIAKESKVTNKQKTNGKGEI